jgi:hypothetical protein
MRRILAAAAAIAALMACRPGVARAVEKPPANEAAQKVLDTIALIEEKLTETKYKHKIMVKLGKGIFHWDCSGMADWVLKRSAPKARKQLPGGRPLAKHFYRLIDKAPVDGEKKGWQQLGGVHDVNPGDLFSWLTPDYWKNNPNTGHVGFVVETPRPHPKYGNVWLIRVADASRYVHENDSRTYGEGGGFGTGTMAFGCDDEGAPLAYGWFGSVQKPATFLPVDMVFGRVTR